MTNIKSKQLQAGDNGIDIYDVKAWVQLLSIYSDLMRSYKHSARLDAFLIAVRITPLGNRDTVRMLSTWSVCLNRFSVSLEVGVLKERERELLPSYKSGFV